MNTVLFMGANHPTSYTIEDEVALALLKRASANKDGASKYVNAFLKWALENYPEVLKPEEAKTPEQKFNLESMGS